MIETENLSVALGQAPILHGVTTQFAPGQITALIGPNGAGKSTLLGALGRLIAPSSGGVRLKGRSLADYTPRDLACVLTILRQNTQVAPRLTVRDLVGFGRYPHSQGRLTEADHRAVTRALERLELDVLADRYLDTLSGGQRQRAHIAMVLAQEAEVVLLDEPLNALDIPHARTVMRIAREEADLGKAVVVVLHDLSIAAGYADFIVALKDGWLHHTGAVADVVRREVLSELYDTDVQVIEHEGRRIVLTV